MSGVDRRSVLVMSLLGAAMGLPSARAQTAPGGYPDTYRQIIADAEREGSLLIYSIMSPENWRPVIEASTRSIRRSRSRRSICRHHGKASSAIWPSAAPTAAPAI